MKQYMLAVRHTYDAPQPPEAEVQTMYGDVERVNEQMRGAGVWVFAGGLLSPETATVVRADGGAITMTDGPYAETKEQLGGFWVLRCADLDEALAWAGKCSGACRAPIEVRPFDDESA